MPISFYDGDPRKGNANKIGSTFFLPNDSGNTKPLVLPGTSMQELTYANNIAASPNFKFKITAAPAAATMQPGDTLQLNQTYLPPQTTVSSYVWSAAQNLSCTNCANPFYIAEKKIATFKKTLLAISSLGCFDSSFVEIKIPPYNDFTITIDSIASAGTDSLYTRFTICNNCKRGDIPGGVKVSFYDADPALALANLLAPVFTTNTVTNALCAQYTQFVKRTRTGKVFAVVNDKGTIFPLVLPNDSAFIKSNFLNNKASINYKTFTASVQPAGPTLEPGDTLQFNASGSPDSVFSFLWFTPQDFSCTLCPSPVYIAPNKSNTKQLIAVNGFGCADTVSVFIKILPADDYTTTINSIDCSRNDSLYVDFTTYNGFKRGIIPKGLQVAFLDANPSTNTAHLFGPVFIINTDINAKCSSYKFFIKGVASGNIYAAVNNNGKAIPFIFPFDTLYLEKNYRVVPKTMFAGFNFPYFLKVQ